MFGWTLARSSALTRALAVLRCMERDNSPAARRVVNGQALLSFRHVLQTPSTNSIVFEKLALGVVATVLGTGLKGFETARHQAGQALPLYFRGGQPQSQVSGLSRLAGLWRAGRRHAASYLDVQIRKKVPQRGAPVAVPKNLALGCCF